MIDVAGAGAGGLPRRPNLESDALGWAGLDWDPRQGYRYLILSHPTSHGSVHLPLSMGGPDGSLTRGISQNGKEKLVVHTAVMFFPLTTFSFLHLLTCCPIRTRVVVAEGSALPNLTKMRLLR